MEQKGTGPLNKYRVIDLSDERGYLLGKFMADLGADVIKVETPDGEAGRSNGPFYNDEVDREKSLFWFAYNQGKRSITLDLTRSEGKEIVKSLIKSADFVIESYAPGYLDSLGLGYTEMAEVNNRIILVSVSAFGQEGPWSNFKASDLIVSAMGGYQSLLGEPDRAPVRVGFPMSFPVACGWALAGALIAHYHREQTGEGQHVDCSAQECQCWFFIESHLYWDMNRLLQRRSGWGRMRPTSGYYIQELFPCKDGSVSFFVIGGSHGARVQRALVEWMDEEGMANDFLKNMDWDSFDYGSMTKEILENSTKPIAEFFKTKTMAELYEQALKRRIMLYPASTVDSLINNRQLKFRNFWVPIAHPELNTELIYPGRWALFTESPVEIGNRPPFVGEHNQDIYQKELGYSREQLTMLRQTQVI